MKAGFVRRTQAGAQRSGNIAIRRPCVTDHEAIREFLTGLSPRARYLRFFSGAPSTGQAMLRILAGEPAHTDVLVATENDVDHRARHGRGPDRAGRHPADRDRRRGGGCRRGPGVGSALVRQLITRAHSRGATALVMEVLAENRQVLTMISDHWPVASEQRSGAYITISARLQPEVPSWPDSRPGAKQWPDHGSWLPGFGKETVAAGIAGRDGRVNDPGGRRRTYEWADPAASAAAARELDGISFFRELIAGRIPPPPITATLGFGWVSVEPGQVVFEITPAEYHYNPIGSVHGGVYATLCDSACGCAVHSMLPACA